MVNASIGVSAGPVRVSQNILPGCGTVMALAAMGSILMVPVFVIGLTQPAKDTITEDGHYAASFGPEGTKIESGTYETTTATGACHWSVYAAGDEPTEEGPASDGAQQKVTLDPIDKFYTFHCGTWKKVA